MARWDPAPQTWQVKVKGGEREVSLHSLGGVGGDVGNQAGGRYPFPVPRVEGGRDRADDTVQTLLLGTSSSVQNLQIKVE